MSRRTMQWIWSAVLAASVCAQQEPPPAPGATPAEVAFRDAWWAESGKNDLAAALSGYLAAAAADGPDAVRARALVAAGAVQQRLGKSESAMATFRQVLRDFADQVEAAEQARVHLGELTAIDLRDGYDEWYDRRLFGEEMQSQLLRKIQDLQRALAQRQLRDTKAQQAMQQEIAGLRGWILGLGKAAVPALRRSAQSADEALAEAAIELLLLLDVLPPTRELLRHEGWAEDADAWTVILRHRAQLEASDDAPTTLSAHLLLAARNGIDALVRAMIEFDLPVSVDDLGPIASAAAAVLRGAPAERGLVITAALAADVPEGLRSVLQTVIAEAPGLQLPLSQWLQLGEGAQRFNLRLRCLQAIGARLRRGDEAVLERALELVEQSPGNALADAAGALCGGLSANVTAAGLQWTPARLVRVLVVSMHFDPSSLSRLLGDLRQGDAGMTAVIDTVFGTGAAALAQAGGLDADGDGAALASAMAIDGGDERDLAVLSGRWHAAVVQYLDSHWQAWQEGERERAIRLLLVVRGPFERAGLCEFARRHLDGASDALRQRLEALRDGCD